MVVQTRRGLVVCAALLALGACGTAGPGEPVTQPSTQPPLTAGEPSETEVPPGSDQSPDGPPAEPDAALDAAELTSLLRTRASTPDRADSCRPADVTARLSGFDVGLGHRYTTLVVTNRSDRPCLLDGVPGLGARGEWGSRFTLQVERGTTVAGAAGPVRVPAGGEAQALVEWTGELAGSGSERASLVVVQLAEGQVPVPVEARLVDVPEEVGAVDIGKRTTLRVSPFEPAAPRTD